MTAAQTARRRAAGRPPAADEGAREALIRAAATRFSSVGYAATSTRDILNAAGATAPALYYHFGSKAGLYLEVAQAAYRHVLEALQEAVAGERRPGERAVAALDALVRLRREHPHVAQLLQTVQADTSQHPELAVLARPQEELAAFWRVLAGGRRHESRGMAMQALAEGLLAVGGHDAPLDQVSRAARVLQGWVLAGFG